MKKELDFVKMNYKEWIIKLLDDIDDENILRFLFKIVKAMASK